MKILHTADWHLGNVFHGHNRMAEHRHFLSWFVDTASQRQPDAVIIAGDVFDNANPSAEAEALFFDALDRLTEAVPGVQVVVIAGNHDSAARLEAPATLLARHGVYVRGRIRTVGDGSEPDFDHYYLPLAPRGGGEAEVVVFAVPFLRTTDYPAGYTPEQGLAWFFSGLWTHHKKSQFRSLPVVAAAHFYARGAQLAGEEHSERLVIGGQDCVDAAVVGRGVCYTALGHLHRAQQVGGAPNAFYAGSALPMSFSERGYVHGANWVDIDAEGHAAVSRIDYHPLRELLSLPKGDGSRALRPEDLREVIASLPARTKGDDGATWPYLELRVAERQPEPGLMHEVTEMLIDRAVQLCRMVRVVPAANAGSAEPAASPDALRRQDPLQMARTYFSQRYGEEMPQALIDRFKTAEQTADEPAAPTQA